MIFAFCRNFFCRNLRVVVVKILTEISICVKNLTLCMSGQEVNLITSFTIIALSVHYSICTKLLSRSDLTRNKKREEREIFPNFQAKTGIFLIYFCYTASLVEKNS